MPNGSYWVGRGGFNYKRSGGGGARRNFPLGLITNKPADVNNTYVVGAGVGASSRATRRAKMLHATLNTPQYPYSRMFNRLGLQAHGGSNDYAYNWYFNDVWPNPYPRFSVSGSIAKTLKYTILPSLESASPSSRSTATSNDGSIIVGDSTGSNGNTVAVRWVNGVVQNLGTLPGDDYSNANFCSSNGSIIVGLSSSISGDRAVKWVNGIISELSPGTISAANGCSPDGSLIVGYYISGITEVACVWSNGSRADLTGLGGTACQANDCSADGSIVVGFATNNSDVNAYAVKWVKNGNSYGAPITLGLLPGKNNSFAIECSDNGSVIVGLSNVDNNVPTSYNSTKWINDSPINLGNLPGNTSSYGTGCSADGTITVGISIGLNNNVDYSTAVKWDNNSISSLGIPPGYTSSQAQACSSDGSIIVGTVYTVNSTSSAIKWYYA
uniref:Uncharacterized protein n=1 Tax=viral metagenome TaxID=1070528 RepID=A0A6C0HRZ2_9ZZZZ